MGKILLIDDEEIIARMYEKSLAAEGLNPVVAIGGTEGLAKAKQGGWDLILLDILMPGMNGIEVLEALKADETTKDIPVVMMTSLSAPHDVEMGMSRGAVAYWIKGDSDAKQLKEKIVGLMEQVGHKK